MVAVAAVVHEDVQVAQGVGGEGLPEVGHQLAVELADLGRGEVGLEDQKYRPPRSNAVVTSVSSMGSVKWP